jgi:muramoyltetrapeptide carboxypeptidase LdcA involved in peptidoglycan recycling
MGIEKPKHLSAGDTIATISCSHGWAGEQKYLWKYELGKRRLEETYGVKVISAPNSMKGYEYLNKNPQARADDITWAFENKNINAVIANMGGNDSIKVIPFIDSAVIKNNPKIFIG